MEQRYKEIICKSACTKTKRSMPYQYDLNIYRGCEHSCKYCYAIYSHKYLESNYNESTNFNNINLNNVNSNNLDFTTLDVNNKGPNSSDLDNNRNNNRNNNNGNNRNNNSNNNFFNEIYIKTNIVKELDKQLSKPSFKNKMIAIGTVTDSYQSIEKEYELMPKILETFIKHKNPVVISTKSDLIFRDLDLIDELSEINFINIAVSITSLDEKIQKIIEPNAISSKRRLNILKKVRKETNASTGLHFMPIIPYLTDSYEHIDSMFKNAQKSNIHCIIPGSLNLFGKTREIFFDFIKKDFPDIYFDLIQLYKKGRVDRYYNRKLFMKIKKIKSYYDIETNYVNIIKEKLKIYNKKDDTNQSTLFDY
jgi:DNA repair photolyase